VLFRERNTDNYNFKTAVSPYFNKVLSLKLTHGPNPIDGQDNRA